MVRAGSPPNCSVKAMAMGGVVTDLESRLARIVLSNPSRLQVTTTEERAAKAPAKVPSTTGKKKPVSAHLSVGKLKERAQR